jgi:hypothetical protein
MWYNEPACPVSREYMGYRHCSHNNTSVTTTNEPGKVQLVKAVLFYANRMDSIFKPASRY